jgi:hypothetical protein
VNGTNLNGVDLFAPRRPDGAGGDPLPQRRGDNRGPEPGPPPHDQRPPIPRQPTSPEAFRAPEAFRGPEREVTGPPPAMPGRPDTVDADVIEDRPMPAGAPPAPPVPSGPPAAAAPPPPAWPPPAWPPVPADAQGQADEAPPVPEALAAALDITSEIPRVRGDRTDTPDPATAGGWNGATAGVTPVAESGEKPIVPQAYTPPPLVAPGQPAPPPPAPEPRPAPPNRVIAYADETMELPIFRELESAWFRARPATDEGPTGLARDEEPQPASTNGKRSPAPAEAEPVPAAAEDVAEVEAPSAESLSLDIQVSLGRLASPPDQAVPSGQAVPSEKQLADSRVPSPDQAWRTAADDGWHAARAAAEPEVSAVTDAGLPKRVPMAQLVPGGVEKAPTNANKRSPEQVRGLLSAYHRGVQRGRTRGGDDAKPPESSTPTGNSHGGKELE